MPDLPKGAREKRRIGGAIAALAVFSVFLAAFKLPSCFSNGVFHSWDLHAHVALSKRLSEQLAQGKLFFYDPWWFGGWPAFTFYAPGAHLLAAAFAPMIALLSADPVQGALQWLSGIALAALPLAIFLAARQFAGTQGRETDCWLAIFSALYGLWFLGHPAEHYGLGATAGLELGLFPQVIAWPLLLLYLAALVRTLNGSPVPIRLSLSIAALAFVHSMSLVHALAVGGVALLWFRARREVWQSHLLGLGLVSFWLLPAITLGKSFTPVDRLPAVGTVFGLLFPESMMELASKAGRTGLSSLSPLPVFTAAAALLLLFGISSERLGRQGQWAAIIFVVSTLLVSAYFGAVFPMSLHQYRLLVLAVLLLLPLFVCRLALACATMRGRAILVPILLLCIGQEWRLFSPRTESDKRQNLFSQEEEVLKFLRQSASQEKSRDRVFFEHLGRPELKQIRSPHYLPSRLAEDSGRETVNGLFIQSSLAQAYPAFAAKRLKIHAYNVRQPIGLTERSDSALLYERLRDFGISDLVLNASDLNEGRPAGGTTVGRYRIIRLPDRGDGEYRGRKLIAFREAAGRLSFKDFEAIAYGWDELWKSFNILSLGSSDPLPSALRAVISTEEQHDSVAGAPVVAIRLPEKVPSRRIQSQEEQAAAELRREEIVLAAIKQSPVLSELLREVPGPEDRSETAVQFDFHSQEIRLENLQPGRLVEIPYSYFPYWQSNQGSLYRGGAERMWFLPSEKSAKLQYLATSAPVVWIGMLMTGLSFVLLLNLHRRLRKPGYTSSVDSGKSES